MNDPYRCLDHATRHAGSWLDTLGVRPVPARASAAEIVAALGAALPDGPTPAPESSRRARAIPVWAVLRVSVSNWSTTDEDVARSLAALRKAAEGPVG